MNDLKNKNLGILWIGDIPDHWKIESLGNVAQIILSNADKKSISNETKVSLCNYTDVYYNNHITSNINFLEATATDLEIERFQLKIDDVLITKDSETPNDIAIPSLVVETKKNLLCGYHLSILRPIEKKLDGSYLLFLIMSECVKSQFSSCATGITRYGLGYKHIKNISICLPPLKTQKAIAYFLDRKTAAIDTLIAKKQRLIQLLEEKRTALINQAVTKGLNAISPMKDSGIPWIGEIPEHWEARRLKFVLDKIVDCKNRTPVYADDGDYAVVRTTNIRQGKFLFENLLKTDRANYEAWSQREVPQAGHIIFTREAPAGEACKVPESLKLCLGQRTMLFIPNEKLLNSDFLLLSIYGGAVDSFVKSVSSGSTVSHLRIEQVGDIPIFVPPLQEQKFISQEIHTQLAKQENLLKITQCSIEKLQEYRRSLITAAVTGKLDITQEKTP